MNKINEIIYPDKDVYVCSSLYNNLEKLMKFKEGKENSIFIINGNVCDQDNDEKIISDIEIIKHNKNFYYVLGDRDLIYIKNMAHKLIFNQNLDWLYNQKYYFKIKFTNQSIINIVCGGVNNSLDSIENCFININWHKSYDGRYGTIISNYPIKDERKIYQYSCSIGVASRQLLIQKINGQELNNFTLL